jgi:predicted ATPase/transcriptional regulator with XRE-family HTH domain
MEPPAFGTLLRRLRLSARLSQEALAERAGISVEAISALERGTRRVPQSATLARLLAALGPEPADRAELEAAALPAGRPGRLSGGARLALPPLPGVPTSFVGRDRELAELAALLRPGRCLTIWGTGGVGKTRLALETARVVGGGFPDGVGFVDLAPLAADDDVVRVAAAAAGVRETPDGSAIDALAAALAGRRALLVLDNAEHVAAGCARLVERLLRDAPSLAVACTSREPLRIAGEHVYPLDPLPVPGTDAAALAEAPAVRLFLDRAESAGRRIDASGSELSAVAAICRRLDAIPLALELAAARAPLMSAAQIARGLDDRFRLLTQGSRTAAARQRTLQGTLDWSFALASETERVVLRRLAVWPASWSLDDAVAVAGDAELERWSVVDAVAGLVNRSLVVANADAADGERRHRLLQTTRAYAFDRLAESGELDGRRRLQAERVAGAVRLAAEAWRGGDDRPFRGLDVDALRAALRWAVDAHGDPPLGAVVAGEAAMFWDFAGLQTEGLGWIDRALAALDGTADQHPAMYALVGRARLARRLHLHGQAYDAARRAAAIARDAGDERWRAIALVQMGDPAAALGRYDEAQQLLAQAAERFERLGDERGQLGALWENAFVAVRSGRYADARDRLAHLVELFRSRGDLRAATQAAINLAEAEFGLGDTRGAIARGYEALAAARALDASLLVGAALQNLAGYLLAADEVGEAARCARESLELASAHGYGVQAGFALGHLADVLARRGRMREAALLTGYVDRLLRDAGAEREAPEQRAYEKLAVHLARELDPSQVERARSEGAWLGDNAVVRLALDLTEPAPGTSTRSDG